ncbi:MAG: glycosyltransferase family 4 protein [Armatimonadetes bacterium]|nr:glycosyltransferase family 4 protein [Armatimonadota bacterium]
MARICLYTEELNPPFDEGMKIFTYNLFREAPNCGNDVIRIGSGEKSVIDVQVRANKLLLSSSLRRAISRFKPDALIYVPIAAATLASFVRARVLKWYAGNVPTAMVGLQFRHYTRMASVLARAVSPDLVYAQSEKFRKELDAMGLPARIVYAGVDERRFCPVAAQEKVGLRAKYGVDPHSKVVLHIGHIKGNRNITALTEAASLPGVQVVLVGSSSTVPDSGLIESLSKKNVLVINGFVENVQELYQLADVYVFPVQNPVGAIEMPLSVLEAMACNLPVVSTRFGGLQDCFCEGEGLRFVSNSEELLPAIQLALDDSNVCTRNKVRSMTWAGVARSLISDILEVRSSA